MNTNIHCPVNNNPVLLPSLNHTSPAHILPSYFLKILTSTPSYVKKPLLFIFPAHILCALISSPSLITNPGHLIFLYYHTNNSVTSNNYEASHNAFFPGFYCFLPRTAIYRVSQEEWTKLRESVPYVKLYRYNPKHLYPKLNGYGDNGQRSLKL